MARNRDDREAQQSARPRRGQGEQRGGDSRRVIFAHERCKIYSYVLGFWYIVIYVIFV